MIPERRHIKRELVLLNAVLSAEGELSRVRLADTPGGTRLARKAYRAFSDELSSVASEVGADVLGGRPLCLLLAAARRLDMASRGTGGADSHDDAIRALRLLRGLIRGLPDGFGVLPPLGEAERDYATRDSLLSRGPELARLASEYGFRDLVLFGSVARGEDDGESDIDLAARTSDGGHGDMFRIVGFSSAAGGMLGRDVNLVVIGTRPLRLDAAINEEGIPLG